MTKLLATTAIMAALTLPSYAGGAVTGNDWVSNCNSDEVALKIACTTYARGVADVSLWDLVYQPPRPRSSITGSPLPVIPTFVPTVPPGNLG
jgi:hypothetical protein